MIDNNIKEFTLELVNAETEKDVIRILEKSGYWQDDSAWREYGDDTMNYSTIGNQQSSADNALVEKLVNSVDAVLMKECLKQGIDPTSDQAPQSIAKAQKQFFNIYNGNLANIEVSQRASLSENILLVATGNRRNPSFSIIDKGEGQSPLHIPKTILSLTKNNKINIPFVQGKFGMGGSGVLRFCSTENSLLLLISKRNHEICAETDKKLFGKDNSRDLWGVTIVRREDPKKNEKNSCYTYLAPDGHILSFSACHLPLLPGTYPKTFHEPLESGTFIKLYEYSIGPSLQSLITLNLYFRLALLMPNIALPIRMLEHRNFKAHSPAITLSGLNVRLDEDKSNNIESEFQTPSTGKMVADSQELDYSIYVFKKGKKENYAKNEGIIFSINGQAHGFMQKDFFVRKAVGMSYLADSILIVIDCSKISRRKQEELFMPSRDRLSNNPMRKTIERELEDILKNHRGLKKLQFKRREEALKDKLQDSKPIVKVLEDILRKSPVLKDLFKHGDKIKDPFDLNDAGTIADFNGKKFPTYFKITREFTEQKPKVCHINHRFRIQFETDVENDYFDRETDPGNLTLEYGGKTIQDYSLNLWNGIANLTMSIPEGKKVGEKLYFEMKVDDISQINPFQNKFYVLINKENKANNSSGNRKKPAGNSEGSDRKKESLLDIPKIINIRQKDWNSKTYEGFEFNRYSALKVKSIGDENGYDFYINLDNAYLKSEIKINNNDSPAVLEARYSYGMVLIGISILNFDENRRKNQKEKDDINYDKNEVSIYDLISQLTEAVSPTLLPMIASLGSLDIES